MKPSLLITGSRGYVGQRLLPFLKAKGYAVKELVGDITNPKEIRSQFTPNTVVIHLAAKINKLPSFFQRAYRKIAKTLLFKQTVPKETGFFEVNVIGTMNIVRLCMENNCKLINMSTTDEQGEYGVTKQLAQSLVGRYTKLGLQAVTIRLCSMKRDVSLNKFLQHVHQVLEMNNYVYRIIVMKEPP